LTLNRSASTTRGIGKAPSISGASTSSSSSIPLSNIQQPRANATSNIDSSGIVTRPLKGGKSLPRKASPDSGPTVPAALGRGKAGVKKAGKKTVKQNVVPKGKIKSVEIIEDSDEEGEEDEGNDEFAKMVGAMMGGDQEDHEGEDTEDEYEEDEDEAALGGATIVAPNATSE
jgi:hypothetical protein